MNERSLSSSIFQWVYIAIPCVLLMLISSCADTSRRIPSNGEAENRDFKPKASKIYQDKTLFTFMANAPTFKLFKVEHNLESSGFLGNYRIINGTEKTLGNRKEKLRELLTSDNTFYENFLLCKPQFGYLIEIRNEDTVARILVCMDCVTMQFRFKGKGHYASFTGNGLLLRDVIQETYGE